LRIFTTRVSRHVNLNSKVNPANFFFFWEPLHSKSLIYCSIGTWNVHDYEPSTTSLVFAGRINGELVGFAGIYYTLVTLVSSLIISRNPCLGHDQRAHGLNVKSSAWMAQQYRKPMDGSLNYHTYIPVKGGGCWAVLLARLAGDIGGRICFGCFDCLLLADGQHPASPSPVSDDDCFPRLHIGYQ